MKTIHISAFKYISGDYDFGFTSGNKFPLICNKQFIFSSADACCGWGEKYRVTPGK